MQADDYPIETILAEPRRFMVPLYQRKYQWTDVRLEPLWDDIVAKATEVLTGSSKFQHYLGALILQPIGEPGQIGVTPRVQVVDGQQRLTTFQIFLAALREVARERHADHIVEYVGDYLFNPVKSKDTDDLTRFKLTPTPSDRALFHDIVSLEYCELRKKYVSGYWGNTVPKNRENHRALRAYELFRENITRFVRFGPSDLSDFTDIDDEDEGETAENDRLEALLKGLLNRMKLVVITLGEGDDAQVIFETLNSKGEPLLAMDLVRNNIFHRAEREGASAEQLYKALWDPFDAEWWRQNAPNARPTRPRIDHFLSHVLAAETGNRISMRELYAEYRNFAVPKGTPRFANVADELALLQRHAPNYELLEGRRSVDGPIHWLGRKLTTWQVTTAYPVALQIAAAEIDDDEREALAHLIYSYIVRRAICGLTAKNLNRIFQTLAERMLKDGPSVAAFVRFFAERTGDSNRFPDDRELVSAVLTRPVYTQAPDERVKDILWELELASRSKYAEAQAKPVGLWTEHVLPRSWREAWPLPDGRELTWLADDPMVSDRNALIDTLGNLTLVTSGLNQSLGNDGFLAKRAKLEEHTSLFLNKWFAKRETWDDEAIRERGSALAEMAIRIWRPLPPVAAPVARDRLVE